MTPSKTMQAHLWQIRNTDKCELCFNVQYTYKGDTIDTEIRAVRQTSENIASMCKHIVNKINYYVNKKCREKSACDIPKDETSTISIVSDIDSLSIENSEEGSACNLEEDGRKRCENNSSESKDQVQNDENTKICDNSDHGGDHDIVLDISIKFRQDAKEMRSDMRLQEIFSKMKEFYFELDGTTYKTYVNRPYIVSITLPQRLHVGSDVTASRIKCRYMVQHRSSYAWYTSSNKVDWKLISLQSSFTPTTGQLGQYIKLECTPKDTCRSGIPFEVVSDNVIHDKPSIPEGVFEKRHQHTKSGLSKDQLRIVSYNTLADYYTEGQFTYCSPEHLAIDYRKQLILKELTGYNADIICLQEVDYKIYRNYLSAQLEALGYGTVFHRKGNKLMEGLMMIYNKKRLKLKKSHQVVLCDLASRNPSYQHILKIVKKDTLVKDQFLRQSTSLQYCRFVLMETGETIFVANTHLYYHKDAGHIRLLQALVVTEYLKFIMKDSNDPKLILCGDFNSKPTSSAFKYLTSGSVDTSHDEVHKLNLNKKLNHNLKFTSAYGTPLFTNYVDEFKGCLDYIFVQRDKMTVTKTVPLPPESELAENVALPSMKFPSDHLALVADVKIM